MVKSKDKNTEETKQALELDSDKTKKLELSGKALNYA